MGQDTAQALSAIKAHLTAACPSDIALTIHDNDTGAPAFSLPEKHPLVMAARNVLQQTTGQVPVLVRLGATVPITVIFQEMLGLQTLMFGYNLPDEDVHAPNEFFRIASLAEGLSTWPRLLEELSTFGCADFRPVEISVSAA
ncbi:acetylornithine deacetylase/succinyl-diaminopimelate desuccinylase-like protein [Bradyrhizobium sp. LB7.1]